MRNEKAVDDCHPKLKVRAPWRSLVEGLFADIVDRKLLDAAEDCG